MPDLLLVFSRWWRWIAAFTLLATLLAAIIAALLPKKYVSVATALPASSFGSDKGAVFNTNNQQLYSALGTPDDLDRIIGTARLDTVYMAAVDALNLAAHYGFGDENARDHAVQKLKRHTAVNKSEWGELKLKVWDRDRNVAAQAANALLKALQQLHQDLQNKSNQVVLQKLKEAYTTLRGEDTSVKNSTPSTAVRTTQSSQAPVYEKLLSEYSLMVAANPPALLVVEAARPALYPDTFEKTASVVVTAFAALLFSVLLALYTEGKRNPA
jgi:uncharacterized protein involved in exopolysaccharide biosynthesis